MKVILIIIFAFLSLANGVSQNLIVSHEQNDEWMNELKNYSLEKQLKATKERILLDTAMYYAGLYLPAGIMKHRMVFIPQHYVESFNPHLMDFKCKDYYAESRLGVYIRYNNNDRYKIVEIKRDTTTRTANLYAILNTFTPNNFYNVEVIKRSNEKAALFGTAYGFGIIFLDTKKAKIFRRISRLNK